ncbi:MAG: GAF and ANTAR domain-containing protein [Actinomycetes bacterium]
MVDRLCQLCVTELGVTGAGIALLTSTGALATVAASNPEMRQVDELQFTVGEGPCVEAFRSRGPVLEADLESASSARWPGFSPTAAKMGVRAVFALPLQVNTVRLGALDLYRDVAGPLDESTLTDALILAEAATLALLELEDATSHLEGAGLLDEPTLWRPEVHQATGRIMVQLGVSNQEALLRLRAHAFARDLSVTEVAREVLTGTLRFDRSEHDDLEGDA